MHSLWKAILAGVATAYVMSCGLYGRDWSLPDLFWWLR